MRSRSWKLVRFLAPLGLIPLFACLAPPVESPKTTVTQETNVRVEQSVKNKVDLLFMIDNSPSMAPKQNGAAAALPAAHQAARRLRRQGQPGLVSHRRRHLRSRRRSVHAEQRPVPSGRRRRQAAGHAGRRRAERARWRARPSLCRRRPLHRLQPAHQHQQHHGRPRSRRPRSAAWLASATAGCGFEHQLEATYRALHDPIPREHGLPARRRHPRGRLRHRRG